MCIQDAPEQPGCDRGVVIVKKTVGRDVPQHPKNCYPIIVETGIGKNLLRNFPSWQRDQSWGQRRLPLQEDARSWRDSAAIHSG
jgi:hypothetical protein